MSTLSYSLTDLSPEHQPPHPRRHDRARAHRAGLQRDDQRAAGQPPLADDRCRPTQRQHLRVRRRITREFTLVASAGDDGAVTVEHDGTDRHVPMPLSQGGLDQREAHRLMPPGAHGQSSNASAARSNSAPIFSFSAIRPSSTSESSS